MWERTGVKTIVLLGALDTKGAEIAFVQEQLRSRGYATLVVDDGVLGQPQTAADVTREEVASAAGRSLSALVEEAAHGSDRSQTIALMGRGAAAVVRGLMAAGRLDAIFSLGGSMGVAMATEAMRSLPFGIPKLMVSTHLYPQAVGDADITLMISPTDIMGLNPVSTKVLARAAGALAGMLEARWPVKSRPLVAVTALGVTTPGVMALQAALEQEGTDSVVFHGTSDFLEQLAEEGTVDGVIDYTPAELVRAVLGANVPARRERLDACGRLGVPMVLVPGSLDMLVLRIPKEQLPAQYEGRKLYLHNPFVTAVRTSGEELTMLAEVTAEKANAAQGPVAVVIPLRGFSEIDKADKAFYEPTTDAAFITTVKARLKPNIPVIELDLHINDEKFARTVASVYQEILKRVTK